MLDRRRGRHGHRAARARHRDGLPELRALPAHDREAENLGFGLKLRKAAKSDRERRVAEVARILGLEALLDRKPSALSGGQRQRVAMGRAMVREPKAFLMDEPLSNLDAKLRVSMRAELVRLHERLGVTTVYVTHDQVEAMTLGQRVAVLRDGVLQQVDTPQMLFHHPVNLFVGAFIGSPSMNLVERDSSSGQRPVRQIRAAVARTPASPTRGVVLGIRPTDLEHAASADPGLPRLRVRADVVEELGAESHVIFAIDAPRVVGESVRAAVELAEDDDASLFADDTERDLHGVPRRRARRRTMARRGSLDPQRLYFFDPATGDVLGRDR